MRVLRRGPGGMLGHVTVAAAVARQKTLAGPALRRS
jgi:hypothetical protein